MSEKNGKKVDFESLGIEVIKTPEQQAHAGIFEPPPGFPKDRFAIEWVPEDQVRYKEQRQTMIGVGVTVPGLTVWRGEDGKHKPEVRHASGNKKFTLMVRPKAVQNVMNALYGDVSKRYHNAEVRGETVAGAPSQDPGMLGENRLRENTGSRENIEESIMALNKVPVAEPEQAEVINT